MDKGQLKEACYHLKNAGFTYGGSKSISSTLKAYKKVIAGQIFVFPRQIPIIFNGEIDTCERPLRAETPKGERVSLACSESIPAGAWMEFEIKCLNETHYDLVREWLDYGFLSGLGGWRGSGKGRFSWVEVSEAK